ncbi:MAG: hypothetical protein K2L47_01440 [Clostridia bacterium]|nr:hypothetical protein [Clostridia bacterium]
MQAIEIVVIVCSILFVIGVTVWTIIRKKKGKSTCGCGECDGNCAHCREALKKAREQMKEDNQIHN